MTCLQMDLYKDVHKVICMFLVSWETKFKMDLHSILRRLFYGEDYKRGVFVEANIYA